MTEATLQALEGIRDLTAIQWYAVPLLAVVFYIYVTEIGLAKKTGDWNVVLAGATVFCADFLNETVNGWILNLSGYSALWTTPGPTAFRAMVGWNLEIIFMFLILGIIYAKTVDSPEVKVFGLPNRWFWAVGYTIICVVIELVLNVGNHLIWTYSFWGRSFGGIWLILIFGYFWFFAVAKFAMERKTVKMKVLVPLTLFAVAVILNLVGAAIGFTY